MSANANTALEVENDTLTCQVKGCDDEEVMAVFTGRSCENTKRPIVLYLCDRHHEHFNSVIRDLRKVDGLV